MIENMILAIRVWIGEFLLQILFMIFFMIFAGLCGVFEWITKKRRWK